jgi:Mce-associated membrane protein
MDARAASDTTEKSAEDVTDERVEPADGTAGGDQGGDDTASGATASDTAASDDENGSDDTDSDAETAGDPAATPDDPAPRRATRWVLSVFVLVVVLVAAVVAGLILLRPVLDYRDVAARRDAILSVARDAAQRSYSLDYESFPQESAKLIAQSAGKYRQGLIDATQGLQHILTQGKVKSTCVITAAGIERDDENTATVLLSITSSVTNTEVTTPQPRIYRVAINLVRQGDQWLLQSNDVIA